MHEHQYLQEQVNEHRPCTDAGQAHHDIVVQGYKYTLGELADMASNHCAAVTGNQFVDLAYQGLDSSDILNAGIADNQSFLLPARIALAHNLS